MRRKIGDGSCKMYIANRYIIHQEYVLLSPQIANPQIPGLIPLSQIRKFLRYASPQIANPQIFFINPKIATPQISPKYCTNLYHNSSKSCPFNHFFNYVQILIRSINALFVRRTSIYLQTFGGFKSANYKKIMVGRSQICKVSNLRKVRKSKKIT
jgi:hypothetical protein